MKLRKIATLGLTLAMLAGTVAGTGLMFASAAEGDFSAGIDNGNEAAAFAAGRSEQEVVAALNEKVADLNTDIAAVSGKTLEEAYRDGEIQAYSRHNEGIIKQENSRSSFKTWDGRPVMDLKFMNDGYDGWGDQSVAWLSYDGVDDEGVIIIGQFARCYEQNGKLGAPLEDKVRVATGSGYTEYQNYANGYMKSENGGNCQVEWKKNVEIEGTTVTEVEADTNAAGYVGAAPKSILSKAGLSSVEFAKAFEDAYDRYAAEGIDVGYSFSNVQNKYGHTSQDFRDGDSVSSPWGGDRCNWAFLAYNYEQGKVYLIRDEFQYVFENGGALQDQAKALGDPAGDDFVCNGKRYQNFAKGYMIADGETAQNTNIKEIVTGKNIGKDGVEYELDSYSRVGRLGISANKALPEGFTAEEFSAEIKKVYDAQIHLGDQLAAVDLTEAANGAIYQKYTDKDGRVHALVYDKVGKTFRYLTPEVLLKYEANMSGLGTPTGDCMKVAEKTGQVIYAYPFETGFIKLTVSEQKDIDEDTLEEIVITKEYAVATMGASFDEETQSFTTISYADRITSEIVNHNSVKTFYDQVKENGAYGTDELPAMEQPTDDVLAKMFQDAYTRAFGLGFSAGEPASEGIIAWDTGNSYVIKLTLKGGNGNANFWGDNTLMTFDPKTQKVEIVTGDIANVYANDGAAGNGWATSPMMYNTATGEIVQNFDLCDKVVASRPIHIITKDGRTQRVTSGAYDFEANKNGGEWIEYITMFGGSISSKPVSVESSYKTNSTISIDFAQFVENKDNYDVTWSLTSTGGALSDAGVFTITPTEAGKVTVTIEARSAFDKLTFNVELNIVEETGSGDNGDDNGNTGDNGNTDEDNKGCNSSIAAGSLIGGAIALGGAAIALALRKKKQD